MRNALSWIALLLCLSFLLMPAAAATEGTPSPDPVYPPVTVVYMDGDEILWETTAEAGKAPAFAPALDANGQPVTGWISGGKKVTDPTTVPLVTDTLYTVWTPPVLGTAEHDAYISGTGSGRFSPNEPLTRAAAAKMLHALLADPSPGGLSAGFTDVSSGAWYGPAVNTLASLGVLGGYEDGSFQPDNAITRAEFITMLSAFYPAETGSGSFSDLPAGHWARKNILAAAARGWLSGYEDGTIRPDRTITRAEAVTVLNAALDRSAASPETQQLLTQSKLCIFTDVRPGQWFYPAVMEAAVPHDYHTALPQETWTSHDPVTSGYGPGLHKIGSAYYQVDANGQFVFPAPGFQTIEGKLWYVAQDGSIPIRSPGILEMGADLYYVNADGSFLTGGTVEYLTFGPDGKYTTGNPQLDTLVKEAMAQCTTPAMTREGKLSACYIYLRENCRYLSRAHQPRGSTSWYEESAIFMFTNHRGNCYCYAAAFMYMARQLGYQAYSVSGGLGASNSAHAWVMIDGRLYDPELEYAYLYRVTYKRYYDLFNIDPYNAPFYYRFP